MNGSKNFSPTCQRPSIGCQCDIEKELLSTIEVSSLTVASFNEGFGSIEKVLTNLETIDSSEESIQTGRQRK